MKFTVGDQTDLALVIALQHEFLRCDDAFEEFSQSAKRLILTGHDRRLAYKTYNAYARFVLHLYEFLMGAARRDFRGTGFPGKSHTDADNYITSHVQRLLTNKREAILRGMSTYLENHISHYPEAAPIDFAKRFRAVRNTASTHVKYERATLDLTAFYRENHKFVWMLYSDVKGWWGRNKSEFPDLQQITAFTVLLEDTLGDVLPPPP